MGELCDKAKDIVSTEARPRKLPIRKIRERSAEYFFPTLRKEIFVKGGAKRITADLCRRTIQDSAALSLCRNHRRDGGNSTGRRE